jgi:hypothetical protein
MTTKPNPVQQGGHLMTAQVAFKLGASSKICNKAATHSVLPAMQMSGTLHLSGKIIKPPGSLCQQGMQDHCTSPSVIP